MTTEMEPKGAPAWLIRDLVFDLVRLDLVPTYLAL